MDKKEIKSEYYKIENISLIKTKYEKRTFGIYIVDLSEHKKDLRMMCFCFWFKFGFAILYQLKQIE